VQLGGDFVAVGIVLSHGEALAQRSNLILTSAAPANFRSAAGCGHILFSLEDKMAPEKIRSICRSLLPEHCLLNSRDCELSIVPPHGQRSVWIETANPEGRHSEVARSHQRGRGISHGQKRQS
jgi:hypothetical protein